MTQERVRNSRGKLAISARATEGLLYFLKSLNDLLSVSSIHLGLPFTSNYKSVFLFENE